MPLHSIWRKRSLVILITISLMAGIYGCQKPVLKAQDPVEAQKEAPNATSPQQLVALFQSVDQQNAKGVEGYKAALAQFSEENAKEKAPLDLSSIIQQMADSYNTLAPEEKALVDRLSDTGSWSPKQGRLFLPNKMLQAAADWAGLTSYATDTPMEPYSTEIETGVMLHIDDGTVMREHTEEPVKQAYLFAQGNYEAILGLNRNMPVLIHVGMLPPGTESFSFTRDGIFFIHINALITENWLRGSVEHEALHIYHQSLDYGRQNPFHEWMMEAQAIWAVSYFDPDLQYHGRYTEAFYSDLSFMPEKTADQQKSWYQYFYFLCQEKGGIDNTTNMIKNGSQYSTFYDLLYKDQGTEMRVQNELNEFGKYIFLERNTDIISFSADSPLADYTVDESKITFQTHADLKSGEGETWKTFDLAMPGYHFVRVPQGNANMQLSIFSDAQADGTVTSGMTVFAYKENKWELLLEGRRDDFTAEVDYGKDDISDLMVVFFNYGKGPTSKSYQWQIDEAVKGKGTIKIVSKTSNMPLGGSGSVQEAVITITEDVEKYSPESSGELADFGRLVTGDVYSVSKMEVSYHGLKTLYDVDDSDLYTQIRYDGNYTYAKVKDANITFQNPLLSFGSPGTGNSATIPDAGNALTDVFKQLENAQGIPGIDQALQESGINDLGGADGINAQLEEAQSELTDMLGDLIPPMSELIRMKEEKEMHIFSFYQTLPPQITVGDWVEMETKTLYRDADGQIHSKVTDSKTGLPGGVFLTWFYNPDFNEKTQEDALKRITMSPQQMAGMSSVSEISENIAIVNGAFDMTNLGYQINTGEKTFDIRNVRPAYIGTQTQTIAFENNILTGKIKASFNDEQGVLHEVTIEIHYDFNP